jgi:hypothetical protein
MKVFNILVSYDLEDSHGNLLTVSELYGVAFDHEKAKRIQSITMNNFKTSAECFGVKKYQVGILTFEDYDEYANLVATEWETVTV